MEEMWRKEIRRKLEGHRKTPPEGVWEGISEQMGLKPATASHPALKMRWYWAAAAAILLVGVGIAIYQESGKERPSIAVTNVLGTEEKSQSEAMNELPTTSSSSDMAEVYVNKKQVIHQKNVLKPKVTDEKENEGKNAVRKETEENQPETDDYILSESNHPEAVAETVEKEDKTLVPYPIPSFEQEQNHSPKESKWTMGIHTSSGLLAANNSTGKVKNYYFINNNNFYNDKTTSYGVNEESGFAYIEYENYRSKHHLPVRLGMSIHYQLSNRVALLSGINYTWLHSEFIKENSTIDQHLHYLGVPVGAAYQLWSNHHFKCYLTGEVMLEKCLNKKPWQWSVEAGAGAEYTITPQVGLYVEPSLGYYFNDGTSYQHYYKDHPLAPSIMLGLRMHIE